ncbi:MAG: hypothetical protein A4E20_02355 [Nitrospira sp. SG-bin2]|jgi:hypothetical protein|nr:MAG: hypothetical protein A4E20_02355 [Nitrospira sp. SG-bin2]
MPLLNVFNGLSGWYVSRSASHLYVVWGLAIIWAVLLEVFTMAEGAIVFRFFFIWLDLWMFSVLPLLLLTRFWLIRQIPKRRILSFRIIGVLLVIMHLNPADLFQAYGQAFDINNPIFYVSAYTVFASPLLIAVLMLIEIWRTSQLLKRDSRG